jgi:hypothetical protein
MPFQSQPWTIPAPATPSLVQHFTLATGCELSPNGRQAAGQLALVLEDLQIGVQEDEHWHIVCQYKMRSSRRLRRYVVESQTEPRLQDRLVVYTSCFTAQRFQRPFRPVSRT